MVSASGSDDFGAECLEAFVRHCVERERIDPNQGAGHRELNAERRAALVAHIDGVLDQYLDWLTLSEDLNRLSS